MKVARDNTTQTTVSAIQEISWDATPSDRVLVVELMMIMARPAYPLKAGHRARENGVGSPREI